MTPRHARHRSCVAVDTNVIIEAHRVGVWRALTGNYPVETVEQCRQEALAEPASGARVRIDADALATPRVTVRAVSSHQRAVLKQRAPDDDLHFGERALWAHLLGRNGPWVMCGPDKASMRCGARLGFAGRIVSLERLLDDIGSRPKRPLHPAYTEKWRRQVLADFALEEHFGPPR